jgi:altronate dehydratase
VKALVINAGDNVATAREWLDRGSNVRIGATEIIVAEPIPRGHKLALRRIRAGDAVVKYGSSIGTATRDIAEGMHVHTHNVVSGRGRGDLAAAAGRPPLQAAEARLAEPPDGDGEGPSS